MSQTLFEKIVDFISSRANEPMSPPSWNRDEAIPFIVTKVDEKVIALTDLVSHELLPQPLRLKQIVHAQSLASFVQYLNDHKDHRTAVFISNEQKFVGMIDYHERSGSMNQWSEPYWLRHSVVFQPQFSTDWLTWGNKDNRSMSQAEFAEFVEDNRRNIINAATMIELSRHFRVNRNAEYKGDLALASGSAQINYVNEVRGTVSTDSIEVPENFRIRLPLWRNTPDEEFVEVECRFRYAIDDGKLNLKYQMIRPDIVVNDAMNAALQFVAEKTEVPCYIGYLGA